MIIFKSFNLKVDKLKLVYLDMIIFSDLSNKILVDEVRKFLM